MNISAGTWLYIISLVMLSIMMNIDMPRYIGCSMIIVMWPLTAIVDYLDDILKELKKRS